MRKLFLFLILVSCQKKVPLDVRPLPKNINFTSNELESLELKAKKGNCDAMFSLGKFYLIIKDDNDQAKYWFDKAEQNGCKGVKDFQRMTKGELIIDLTNE